MTTRELPTPRAKSSYQRRGGAPPRAPPPRKTPPAPPPPGARARGGPTAGITAAALLALVAKRHDLGDGAGLVLLGTLDVAMDRAGRAALVVFVPAAKPLELRLEGDPAHGGRLRALTAVQVALVLLVLGRPHLVHEEVDSGQRVGRRGVDPARVISGRGRGRGRGSRLWARRQQRKAAEKRPLLSRRPRGGD